MCDAVRSCSRYLLYEVIFKQMYCVLYCNVIMVLEISTRAELLNLQKNTNDIWTFNTATDALYLFFAMSFSFYKFLSIVQNHNDMDVHAKNASNCHLGDKLKKFMTCSLSSVTQWCTKRTLWCHWFWLMTKCPIHLYSAFALINFTKIYECLSKCNLKHK